LPPSPADHLNKLGISVGMPEPHDFAVHDLRVRLARARVHCIPHPTFRDDRETPLNRDGMGEIRHRFGERRSDLFLVRNLDRPDHFEINYKISFCAHVRSGTHGQPERERTIEMSKTICLSGGTLSGLVVVGRDDAMRAKGWRCPH
jgi:hypothetical protein